MRDKSQPQGATRHGLLNNLRRVLPLAFGLCAPLLLVGLVLLTLDGPNRRVHMDEASSVSRLRNINRFRTEYVAMHPTEGFACRLSLLRQSETAKPGEYEPEEYLVSGTQHSYKYVVANCHAGANGVASHYGVVALPLSRDVALSAQMNQVCCVLAHPHRQRTA